VLEVLEEGVPVTEVARRDGRPDSSASRTSAGTAGSKTGRIIIATRQNYLTPGLDSHAGKT
jgi:hypothetical protein